MVAGRVNDAIHTGKVASQSASDVQSRLQFVIRVLVQSVPPSARLRHRSPRAQNVGHASAQVAQVPLAQLGVAPLQVPQLGVLPPQVSGQAPQLLPRLAQVAGVQQTPSSVQTCPPPQVPQESVCPQPLGQEPQFLPRLWQVAATH